MKTEAKATFEIKHWDEKPYDEVETGPKLTRAAVTKTFQGDVSGDSTVEYLMMHRPEGTSTFVGLERFSGKVLGRSGTLVFEHLGTFEDGAATTKWRVLPGSGTGELQGLVGEGTHVLPHAERFSVTFDFDLG